MSFEKAVEVILDKEKGYVKHPKDPGGETNWGITKRYYPHLNIKTLTRDQAREIYLTDFWDKLNLRILPYPLALLVFDSAVNQGQPTAIHMLKDCLGVLDRRGGIIMDDMEKIEEIGVKEVMKRFIHKRRVRYYVTKNFDEFGTGWIDRLLDVSVIAFMEK